MTAGEATSKKLTDVSLCTFLREKPQWKVENMFEHICVAWILGY